MKFSLELLLTNLFESGCSLKQLVFNNVNCQINNKQTVTNDPKYNFRHMYINLGHGLNTSCVCSGQLQTLIELKTTFKNIEQ